MLRAALTPVAWAYGGLTAARGWAYDRGLLAARPLPVPVISVGSVVMGGTGKTPVTRWIAQRMANEGLQVGVVCGAYGGATRDIPSVIRGADREIVRRHGDEAGLLAGWLPDALVVGGRDKLAAAWLAVRRGAEVVVVDDGFQHRRLARAVDIVVHRGPIPPMFPVGWARESAAAIRRAHLRWHHNRDMSSRLAPNADVVSRNHPAGLRDVAGNIVGNPQMLAGRRVCLMAAVAHPADFCALVQGLGAQVVGQVFIRDHQPFRARDFRRAARTGAELLLCTEKDAVRMIGQNGSKDLTALVCELEILSGTERVTQIVNLERAMVRSCGS